MRKLTATLLALLTAFFFSTPAFAQVNSVTIGFGNTSGSGGVTSVTNSDGTITVNPTTGAVILSIGTLPNPSASTLGGIQSYALQSHQWINSISTSGIPASSQPNFTDLLGTISNTQLGTVGVGNGGTGLTTVATNDLLLGNGTGVMNVLAPGSPNQILAVNGAGTALVWITNAASNINTSTTNYIAYYSSGSTPTLSGEQAVPVANGGTGQTTLTSGQILVGNGTGGITSVAVPLSVANGGTGQTTLASGNVLLGNGTSGITSTATLGVSNGGTGQSTLTSGNVLLGNGTSGITSTATVGVSNGGTGVGTLAADGVLYGNGTSAVGVAAVGSAGNVLTSNGAGNAPTMQSPTGGIGGNGADGAITLTTTTIQARKYNATTFTTTASDAVICSNCVISASSTITLATSSTLEASSLPAGATPIANPGGAVGGTSAIGGAGSGPQGGGGGQLGAAAPGPGGGAGSAGSGGAGGGAITSLLGYGGGNGNGTFSGFFTGNLNGSGGGGGGSGSSGSSGAGGGGASHLVLMAAGGFAGTGTVSAQGQPGAASVTAGSGGGGGGGGTVEIYCGSGNMPALTVNVAGGAGGAGSNVYYNGGGGGGGFSFCQAAGTVSSATFTVSGGAAGTGGSGGSAFAGQSGLSNTIASTAPTLPFIAYNHANSLAASKALACILLAKKQITGQDFESEKSHHFTFDGNERGGNEPLEFVAATYSKKGKFQDLQYCFLNGGNADAAEFCDAGSQSIVKKAFAEFNIPALNKTLERPQTCDAPGDIRAAARAA